MEYDNSPEKYSKKFLEIYEFIKVLGKGTFGKVVECRLRNSGEEWAVKYFKKSEVNREELMEEVNILSSLDHANIVKYRTARENSKYFFIEMELLKGGSLMELLETRRFSELEAAQIMKQIFSALQYIHEKDTVHRDIKPENILFTSEGFDKIKIIDFGLSAKFESEAYARYLEQSCGTVIYMAPEQAKKGRYSSLIDVWSAAMIMYHLIVGRHPLYNHEDTVQTYFAKLSNVQWYFPACFSPLAQNLFLHLAKPLALERYWAEQALLHPWISRNIGDQIPLTFMDKLRNYNNSIRLQQIFKAIRFCSLVFYRQTGLKLDEQYKSDIRARSDSVLESILKNTSDSPEVKRKSNIRKVEEYSKESREERKIPRGNARVSKENFYTMRDRTKRELTQIQSASRITRQTPTPKSATTTRTGISKNSSLDRLSAPKSALITTNVRQKPKTAALRKRPNRKPPIP